MKKGLSITFLLIILALTVSAKVIINNFTIDSISSSLVPLEGEINLTITSEDAKIMVYSNDNDSISLKEFLDFQNSYYTCSTEDCSSGYDSLNEISGIIFEISPMNKKLLGMVFTGGMAVVESINFTIESDFSEKANQPLKVDYFGKDSWAFEKFSNTFLTEDWGCYDNSEYVGTRGPQIGKNPYCELIYLPKTDKVKMGAKIGFALDNTTVEEGELTMYLYDYTGSEVERCNYLPTDSKAPNEENLGCEIEDKINFYSAGYYYVCVGSQDQELSEYRIYTESTGKKCGFPYGSSPINSSKDYAIFAKTVKYANYSYLPEEFILNIDDLAIKANKYLIEKYGGTLSSGANCNSECILPFTLSGATQRAKIKDIEIIYRINDEYDTSTKIYELNITPATINFDGILDLRLLDFTISKTMNYILKIGEYTIFSKIFNITSVPKILTISPMNPSAGIPIKIYVKVDFQNNNSLTYYWDMGDGINITTYEPYVTHTYKELKHYTITVGVSAGENLRDSKSFDIETITPKVAITTGLLSKGEALFNVKKIIDTTPFWYRDELLKIADITGLMTRLDVLDRNYQSATKDADYIKIASEIYDINVPVSIEVIEYDKPYLINTLEDVNIDPILEITGDFTNATSSDYAKAILSWQNTNIEASLTSSTYKVLLLDETIAGHLSAYTFQIKSNSDENSYFAINAPLNSLYFGKDVGALESGTYTLIPIRAFGEGYFEFYYKSEAPLSYFVSPALTSIVIESDIDTTCNYNNICEENSGETYLTCRNDCKPVGKAILYGIFAIIGVFIFYLILSIWYNRRYEKYLFKDGRELYNLLMFIANAKTRGMEDSKIANNLKRQGWSGERVAFVIKKANGKRTGLIEIIPFSKISAIIRNIKSKNDFKKQLKQNNATNQNNIQPMGPPNLPPPLMGDPAIARARNNTTAALKKQSKMRKQPY